MFSVTEVEAQKRRGAHDALGGSGFNTIGVRWPSYRYCIANNCTLYQVIVHTLYYVHYFVELTPTGSEIKCHIESFIGDRSIRNEFQAHMSCAVIWK